MVATRSIVVGQGEEEEEGVRLRAHETTQLALDRAHHATVARRDH